MSDDLVDPVNPLRRSPRVEPHDFELPSRQEPKPLTLRGRIAAVTPGHAHDGETHRLDVTVGGSTHTEILVTVPNGAYGNLEGREVVLRIEP
ncbi:MAG: hypothetical protein GC168_15640 [Candidatus Hydrogenedens sp.]|nr:hypothetical protein [Candidatus Hydrogenedens sp.]